MFKGDRELRVKEYLRKVGNFSLLLSFFLFSISIPTSIALDNFAAAFGILGFLLLLLSKEKLLLPPLAPVFFLGVPEILSALLNRFKLTKTDINHHLVSYFVSYRTLLSDSEKFWKFINLLVFSSAVSVFVVVFEAFTWQNVKHLNVHNLSFHSFPIRPEGLLNHPLTTAGVFYVLLILFVFLSFRFRKLKYYLIAFLLLLGIIFTQSRSYWLGSSLFIILVILFYLQGFKRLFAFLLLLFSFSSLFVVPPLKSRLESISNTKNNWSNLDRLILWTSHLKAFKNDYSLKEKIFGTGEEAWKYSWRHFPKSFTEITGKPYPKINKKLPPSKWPHFHGGLTHNIYLKFLTKYGILGLLGYLIFWAYILLANFKATLRIFRLFSFGYIGFLLAGFFENNFTDAEVQFAIWFVLGINFAFLHLEEAYKTNFSGSSSDKMLS